MEKRTIIARPKQLIDNHLFGVEEKAKCFASKIGLADCGGLLNLLHDIGKYSHGYQNLNYAGSVKWHMK